jgi:hypothetical protein
MNIEEKIKYFTPKKTDVKFDHVRVSKNEPLLISVMMHRAINGLTHPFRIKRQLAVTRKYCRTVTSG